MTRDERITVVLAGFLIGINLQTIAEICAGVRSRERRANYRSAFLAGAEQIAEAVQDLYTGAMGRVDDEQRIKVADLRRVLDAGLDAGLGPTLLRPDATH